MTRLSDSLRGLADRAPIDDVTVSVAAAARRVERGRRLRVAANATAGVGAAAVIALAAIQPGLGTSHSARDDSKLASAADGAVAAPAPQPGAESVAGGYASSWLSCGARPLDSGIGTLSADARLSLTAGDEAWDSGSAVTVDATLLPAVTGDYSTTGVQTLVLWQGYVVAFSSAGDASIQSVKNGVEFTSTATVNLVNCWDGAALPAGDYQVLGYQDFTPAGTNNAPDSSVSAGPVAEPSGAATEASASASAPTVAPDAAAADGSTGPAAGPAVDAMPVDPGVGTQAVVLSDAVDFTIPGDPVENPFGSYLGTAPTYPDDYLDPATARSEFARRLTSQPWDMAPGTQRVVKSNDAALSADQNDWMTNYFGCPWDGSTAATFPAQSAVWPLLQVAANLPSSITVSYGWVVDDNPKFNLSVKNISGYSLPGFYGQPNSSLLLVKDGQVVAEAYPAMPDQSGSASASDDGFLSPDGTLSSDYLWRDVNGCWTGNAQTKVAPGTYTVLNLQSLYLDNGQGVMYFSKGIAEDGTAVGGTQPDLGNDARTGSDAPSTAASIGPGNLAGIVAPQPGDPNATQADWVELQVWTSLGKVTVR